MPVLLKLDFKGRGLRGTQRAVTVARKETWQEVGTLFHGTMRDKRFTSPHAREAGYYLRKGESMAVGSKEFRRSYTGKKFRLFGHTRPLEFTGKTRLALRSANISSFALKVQVKYSGARTLNLRNPKSRINMSEEFRRILPSEERELGQHFNSRFEERYKSIRNYYEG